MKIKRIKISVFDRSILLDNQHLEISPTSKNNLRFFSSNEALKKIVERCQSEKRDLGQDDLIDDTRDRRLTSWSWLEEQAEDE